MTEHKGRERLERLPGPDDPGWEPASCPRCGGEHRPWVEREPCRAAPNRSELLERIGQEAGRAFEIAAGADNWNLVGEVIEEALSTNDPRAGPG